MCESAFVGYLKGKSTLMIFERHAHLKYKYGQLKFWCIGYYAVSYTHLTRIRINDGYENDLRGANLCCSNYTIHRK